MNYQYEPENNYYEDGRQFNLPGYMLNQIFGGGQQFPGQPGGFPGSPPPGFPGQPGGPFPGFPGGGFPGQPGGFPGGDFPGQQPSAGPPSSPPPSFQPTQPQVQLYAVDPGGIRGCLYRYTYIWLRRDSFWFYPTYVGRKSIAGYRWQGYRWVYYGIDLDKIDSYQCY
ncbi:hypothetical protein [Virgibacillus sp. SK37]|uniref:hypothetical protein n=1 Tax=Virgibacillus sp. SK37 TaxID=403957 RepID=UPI0004D1EF8C|nr:hypothetical protein [Virgibacillus sp. SK37]AIF42242.1 hypothetical protein X953_02215 [Virgibacillus sp. SK37]